MARKTEKGAKFRNVRCRTWNLSRKLKIMEREKQTLDDLKIDEITEKRKMRNAHCRTWNMVRKLKTRKMRNMHTIRREICRRKLKKVESSEMSTVGPGIWQEN
jgi:hypothetical protein